MFFIFPIKYNSVEYYQGKGNNMELLNIKKAEQVISKNKKVFVRFYAPWCPITVANEPEWKSFVKANEKEVTFIEVNIDDSNLWEEDGNKQYAIKLTPTYAYYLNGKLVWRKDNKQSEKALSSALNLV